MEIKSTSRIDRGEEGGFVEQIWGQSESIESTEIAYVTNSGSIPSIVNGSLSTARNNYAYRVRRKS